MFPKILFLEDYTYLLVKHVEPFDRIDKPIEISGELFEISTDNGKAIPRGEHTAQIKLDLCGLYDREEWWEEAEGKEG